MSTSRLLFLPLDTVEGEGALELSAGIPAVALSTNGAYALDGDGNAYHHTSKGSDVWARVHADQMIGRVLT